MTNLTDTAFFGGLIISFNTAILTPQHGSDFYDLTVAVSLKLSSGSLCVVKFALPFLEEFCGEIKSALDRFPEADQRDQLNILLENQRLADEVFELLSGHPIVMYIHNIPCMPPETHQAKDCQYVKFIHMNAYSDLFKFDITFADDSTSRFSMPSSVVFFLLKSLEQACTKIRSLQKLD